MSLRIGTVRLGRCDLVGAYLLIYSQKEDLFCRRVAVCDRLSGRRCHFPFRVCNRGIMIREFSIESEVLWPFETLQISNFRGRLPATLATILDRLVPNSYVYLRAEGSREQKRALCCKVRMHVD